MKFRFGAGIHVIKTVILRHESSIFHSDAMLYGWSRISSLLILMSSFIIKYVNECSSSKLLICFLGLLLISAILTGVKVLVWMLQINLNFICKH